MMTPHVCQLVLRPKKRIQDTNFLDIYLKKTSRSSKENHRPRILLRKAMILYQSLAKWRPMAQSSTIQGPPNKLIKPMSTRTSLTLKVSFIFCTTLSRKERTRCHRLWLKATKTRWATPAPRTPWPPPISQQASTSRISRSWFRSLSSIKIRLRSRWTIRLRKKGS